MDALFIQDDDYVTHLNELLPMVKEKLSSIDAANLCRSWYNLNYTNQLDKEVENVFGNSLFRESESPEPYDGFDDLLAMYVKCGVKDNIGMSLNEFLSLTPSVTSRVLRMSKEIREPKSDNIKELNKLMEEL